MKRLAVLPARGGSKRVKDKNIREVCGKPIIHYPLAAAKESGLFDTIHVSTDSPEIAQVVEGLGFPVAFMRDSSLADDRTGVIPVVRWVLERYKSQGRTFDDVCLLYPCAALIEAGDLAAACGLYEKAGRKHPLLSVSEFPVPIEWAYQRESDGRLIPREPGKSAVRSQDLGKKYFDTGGFIFFNASDLLRGADETEPSFLSYVLPRHKAVDVDVEEDFELTEMLLRGRKAGP